MAGKRKMLGEGLCTYGGGIIWFRRRVGGRVFEEKLGRISLTEAKRIRDEVRVNAAREGNGLTSDVRVTLGDAMSKRLAKRARRVRVGRDLSEDRTYLRYKNIVETIFRHLSPTTDARWISERDWGFYEKARRREGVGNATLNRELTFLRSSLALSLKRDPLADVEALPERKPGSIAHEITESEHSRLLAASIRWVRNFLGLLRDTGAREEELCLVELRDITNDKLERGWGIYFRAENTKGEHATRWVPLTEPGILSAKDQLLEARRAGAPFLFFARDNAQCSLSPKTVQNYWRRLRKRAKVMARIHDYRHTFITQELLRGTSPEIVARLVGHTTTRMIQTTYGHLIKRHWEDLAAARRGHLTKWRGDSVGTGDLLGHRKEVKSAL